MYLHKLIGVICLAIGLVLLYLGHEASQGFGSTVKNFTTGSPTDKVIYYYLGGAVLGAVGVFQLFWKRK
jgi:hypothetical protein